MRYNTEKLSSQGLETVRDDLKGLEISQNELQLLTNLPVNNEMTILINPLKKIIRDWIAKIQGPEGATVVFIGTAIFLLSYIIFDVFVGRSFANLTNLPSWIILILFCFFGGAIIQLSLYIIWKQKLKILEENMTHSLNILLNDVDRYNAVVKAIDINDQIEAAGNSGVEIKERSKVIEALQLTRTDLIRALKTERILRENKKFILKNTDLFINNLAALTAMQVTEQASEHGKLLNEALQIALDVQHEMKRLESQH
ncbi:hypothetical protein PCC6912_26090 [Chlorogloeopsis fritschii PCC 6912]|uniref:Uncharacterized protein n=1 Tax=Chlorogloeopsis fritschii PCC 6912 TaxID=211165 RepID=A0A3S0ZZF5_CHLFR|nr:hypothetical protein [Chlorogloeopsis fritschii]RUR81740.1 hypothetical protein PCC6912_26090 [Chlorogloeopsis fritschii PCC 6912]